MSKPRGKDDFLQFFIAFEKRKNKDQSLADFCRAKDVEYKTARNWASKLRGESIYPTDGVVPKDTAGTGTGKQQGQGQDKGQQKGKDAGGSVSDSKITPRSKAAEPITPGAGQPRDSMSWLKKLANLKPYEKDVPRPEAITHGAYTRFLPPHIQAELDTYGREDLRSVIEEIRLTKGRLMLVQENKASWDARHECGTLTDEDYTLETVEETKGGLNGDLKTTKRKRPDFEHHEDRLSRRLAWLMQVQDQLSKKAGFTADEAIAMRRSIIERGEAESWTYSQIGMEIEKHGIELPFTLQALIRHELEQPIVDTEATGITDEDLDKLSQQYAQESQKDDEWLQSRQAEVKQIHDGQDASKTAS